MAFNFKMIQHLPVRWLKKLSKFFSFITLLQNVELTETYPLQ